MGAKASECMVNEMYETIARLDCTPSARDIVYGSDSTKYDICYNNWCTVTYTQHTAGACSCTRRHSSNSSTVEHIAQVVSSPTVLVHTLPAVLTDKRVCLAPSTMVVLRIMISSVER